jgi:hypothetical protein
VTVSTASSSVSGSGSSSGIATVGITAAANAGTVARTATVTFTGGDLTQTVSITQAASPAALSVSPSTVDFAAGGGTQNLAVISNVNWMVSRSEAWVTVSTASGSGNAAVGITAAANTGNASRTASVTFTGGGLTQSIAVTQEAQGVNVEPTPPDDGRGTIELMLRIPVDEPFSVTFILNLPAGFILDPDATSLVDGLLNDYQLSITPNGQGGWLFAITPKLALRNGDEMVQQQVVDIAYTLDETVAVGEHEVKISNADLTLLESGTTFHQEEINVPVTVTESSVGNATVETPEIVYFNGILSVNTPAAEGIEVYSVGGQLLYRVQKAAGAATFDLNRLPRGVLIVRGSSGWVRKAVK